MGKKFLILTDRFYPEDFIINDLIAEFADRIKDVEVLTQNPSYPYGRVSNFEGYRNKLFSKSEWQGVKVRRIFTIQGYKKNKFLKVFHYLNFTFLCSIYLLIFGWRYNRIFIFQTGPLTQALPAVISRKIYHQKIVIWTLDLWPDTVYAFGFKKTRISLFILNLIVSFVYRNCSTVFISSKGFFNRISEYTSQEKIFFLPQWPRDIQDAEFHKPILNTQLFNFTFAGNIAKTQNLENVILGFSKAIDQFPKMQLNIFGDGSNLENLLAMVEREKIQNVRFWGRVSQERITSILEESDVLLISLKPDPLFDLYIPLKFSSYLKAKKPVFAIMNGDIKSMVAEYRIGISSNPADINQISEGFLSFSTAEPELLHSYSENTQILMHNIFDRNTIIEKLFSNI